MIQIIQINQKLIYREIGKTVRYGNSMNDLPLVCWSVSLQTKKYRDNHRFNMEERLPLF